MFSKEGGAGSGPAMMLGSALKMLGLQPQVIENLSRGLLTDLHTVASLAPEMLARQEFILKRLPAADASKANAWVEYLDERNAEYAGRYGIGHGDGDNPDRNGGASQSAAAG